MTRHEPTFATIREGVQMNEMNDAECTHRHQPDLNNRRIARLRLRRISGRQRRYR